MHHVGIAEEVVQVAQNLLVCTHKEDTDVVRLILLKGCTGR